jgi:hypothetical protein
MVPLTYHMVPYGTMVRPGRTRARTSETCGIAEQHVRTYCTYARTSTCTSRLACSCAPVRCRWWRLIGCLKCTQLCTMATPDRLRQAEDAVQQLRGAAHVLVFCTLPYGMVWSPEGTTHAGFYSSRFLCRLFFEQHLAASRRPNRDR